MSENNPLKLSNEELAVKVVWRRTNLEFRKKNPMPPILLNHTEKIAERFETEWMKRFPDATPESHSLLNDARVTVLENDMFVRGYKSCYLDYLRRLQTKTKERDSYEKENSFLHELIEDSEIEGIERFNFIIEYLQLNPQEIKEAAVRAARRIILIDEDEFVIDLLGPTLRPFVPPK